MVKVKLIDVRKSKKICQEEISFHLGMTQSQYSRREKGDVKISGKEWLKIASILKVEIWQIYESDDDLLQTFLMSGTEEKFQDKGLFEYLAELEKENQNLKNEIQKLTEKVPIS